jgi:hypothetical protein
MSRLPYFLDIRLKNGGGVASLTLLMSFNLQEVCRYSFLLEAE